MRIERLTYAPPGQNQPSKELLCQGNFELIHRPGVAIVGSRRASLKGLDAAKDCAAQLALSGVHVVSGYANGVDLISHKTALESGGTTTLVLPEGINRFFIKKEIRQAWDWNRVLVVSEFPPDAAWSAAQAMQRNSTICMLSRAVIVAEAQKISGTMRTVRRCLKQQVPLFVVYYDNMDDFAQGNLEAIQLGGRPLYKGRLHRRAKIAPILQLIAA